MSLPERAELIKEGPHWLMRLHPTTKADDLIGGNRDARQLLQDCQIHYARWEFPELPRARTQFDVGEGWVSPAYDPYTADSYCRLHMSGQFVYMRTPIEISNEGWQEELISRAEDCIVFGRERFEAADSPQFLDIEQILRQIIFWYLFSSRLAIKLDPHLTMKVSIELRQIQRTALMAPKNRLWHDYFETACESIKYEFASTGDALGGTIEQNSLKAIQFFMEHFGWLDSSETIFVNEIRTYLSH
ncbi:MAG: hypothetical protein ACF8GE_00735 [Phycisphaerales bacterium JB043]